MSKHPGKKLKNIFSKWKMGDFFRNFVAVVLGIAITFIGGDLISKRNSQQEVSKAMQLVKSELQINRGVVQEMLNREIREQNAARYLFNHKNDLNRVPSDSLYLYAFQPFQMGTYTYTSDAMEMLKMSSLIQKVKNKELALQIIRSYDAVKSAATIFESFIGTKKMMQEKMMANPKINDFFADNPQVPTEIWTLLFSQTEGIMFIQYILNCHDPQSVYNQYLETIDATLAAIEKEYK